MTERVHALAVIDGLGRGGAEALLTHLAGGSDAAGLRLSVAYLYDKDDSCSAAPLRAVGIDVVRLPVGGLVSPRSLAITRAHVASVRPHVVHTHLGYADLLAGTAAASLGVPSVSTIHLSTWGRPSLREALKGRLIAAARRRGAARVVAVSDAARDAYLAQGWDRPEHVVTLHNGVLDAAAPGSGAAVRRELGLAPDDVVLAMVSVLRPGKGHTEALRALTMLRHTHPEVRLLIVGDGPLRADLERAARDVPGAVLAGHRTDVMCVLDAADVLLHPSEHDAFPTTLLEAMAAGVPVVATRVGGIPEIVVAGSTGLLVEPPPDAGRLAAALAPLLDDPALRQALGRAGRARYVERFTADAWARRVRDLYVDVLAEQR